MSLLTSSPAFKTGSKTLARRNPLPSVHGPKAWAQANGGEEAQGLESPPEPQQFAFWLRQRPFDACSPGFSRFSRGDRLKPGLPTRQSENCCGAREILDLAERVL